MAFKFFRRDAGDAARHPSRLSPGIGLIVWLLVVPLALLALGLWQLQRAELTLDTYGQVQTGMPETLADLKRIAAEDPNAIIDFEGEGAPSYPASLAVAQFETTIAFVDEALQVSKIRRPLVWGTLAGAVLAFLGGIFGLVMAGFAGMRARRSREQLVKSFARFRRVLPFLLGTLILGLSVCAVSATLFEAVSLWFQDRLSTGSAKLALAGVVLAAVTLYGAFLAVRGLRQVFALYTPDPIDASGRIVGETDAPELWRFVRDLAERQNALMPDTIVVGLTDSFFVTEAAVLLWPAETLLSGRILYLPASYLGLLSEPEISAIIGHELAHFSGEDTAFSRQFAPIYASLWRALGALDGGEAGKLVLYPAVRLGFHALHTFDVAVAHWSRLREFEADRRGSLIGGPAGAASALLRTSLIAPVTTSVLDRAFAAPNGAQPDLVAEVSRQAAEVGFPDPAEHLEDRQPHPTDSHPPTSQRISALGVELADGVMERATRVPDAQDHVLAHTLFQDWSGLCRALSADFLDNARRIHALHREGLEAAVASIPTDDTVLYENARPMIWTMVVLAAFMTAFGISVVVFAQPLGFSHDGVAQAIIVSVTGVGVLGALLYAAGIHRRNRRPLMILTPDALMSRSLREPIAWIDVADFQVFAGQRFALTLALHEEAHLPSKIGFALYTKVNRRKRIVTLGSLGVRGMKPDDFASLVSRYVHAAHAREYLASS